MAQHADQHAGVSDPAETPVRHERPEDWGWHGSFGRLTRIAGWISAISLLLMNFTWHYNQSADPWMYGLTALLIGMLIWDRYRRRNAWRE